MRMGQRLLWGALFGFIWFGAIGPALSDAIVRSTLEGPAPFSASWVRDQLDGMEDTGSGEETQEYEAIFARLAVLRQEENERVTALWNVVDEEVRSDAKTRIGAVPPLQYAVDPRFFDPLTPSIIRRVIEAHGYALKTLPMTTSGDRGKGGDQETQLMTVLSLIHHQMLSEEQAAMVLSGALELLDLQTERKSLEQQLKERFESQLGSQ